jgi:hypothetical protein
MLTTMCRRRPPERFHVFVSYTTREEEVQVMKPIVDSFLNDILGPALRAALGEPPAFYDGYWLRDQFNRSAWELEMTLQFAIEESEVLVAFISPEYIDSPWCKFELSKMASKAYRPWFDLIRDPPVWELRDQRRSDRQPSLWERFQARFLMAVWRSRKKSMMPGGEIVPVLWKGEERLLTQMPEVANLQWFDWRVCVYAFRARAGVAAHLLQHGSVSPAWAAEAQDYLKVCHTSMRSTALAIAEVLRQRRLRYGDSGW